ncbi:MAG: hemerythrin family protein [Gammaproteobacteria bacterium]|nr:hemerythrin family protein [Gammaproteobacteria bacterium]
MQPTPSSHQRHRSQKVVMVFAYLSYALAITCAVGAFVYQSDQPADPIRASLMASVVFFIGCGVVLHVIGTTRLSGILSATHPDDKR